MSETCDIRDGVPLMHNENISSYVPVIHELRNTNRGGDLEFNNDNPPSNATLDLSHTAQAYMLCNPETSVITDECTTPYTILRNLRVKFLNRLIFASLNINSIRNKFIMLSDLVRGNVDVLFVCETKIDQTFPSSQFVIPGFTTPYRLDRTGNGGGVMLYIREDIPSRRIPSELSVSLECCFVVINQYKKKWLIIGTYNPTEDMISPHLDVMRKCIDGFLREYENFVIMRDFNSQPNDNVLKEFL